MDRVNSLLPKEEKSFILTDDERNLKQLQSTLSMLANKSSLSKDIILDVKLLGSAIQLVRARKSLKYTTDALYFESTLQCLHDCYVSQKMSSATQSRMLQVMTDLCKERKYFKNFHVDWRVFWNQSIAIATRTKKAESMASAEILVEVLTKSATFLHEARHFIQPDEVEKIVEESMAILTDTRQQGCTEGLLMLINCLPTKYAHYDTMLPIWLKLWTSIQHNVSWDACWLTLLCRARKHCPQFDWRPYVSLMLVKTKELLQLATGANVIQGRQFPLDLPEQYMRIANFRLPNRRTALYKITKLLYAAVAQGNNVRVTAYPITITPPKLDENCLFNRLDLTYPGYNAPLDDVSATAVEIGMFFQTIRHFLHASNSGQHTGNVALVLAAFAVEIGRHVGHELADALVGPSTSRAPTLPTPVHMPTVTYLNGLLTLLALEGLFGKDQSSNYQNASTLKMLMSIDPNLGHILVPILIAGLTTVNQTHQAPIALYTLNLVFRQLMFPTPVLLQYLPAILPLVLPGLDPSDSAKSVATLTFVSTVLAWLPVRAEYKLPSSTVAPVSYLSLLPTASIKLTNACDHSNPALQLAPKDLQAQYDVLAATLGSWVPLFLEKFFALLDAIEGKQEGRKVSGGIGPNMCECIGFLFQSMGTGPTAQQVQAQVLEHFRKNTPSNATKVCGKLFEYMTAARPDAVLGAVIDAFLDKDTLTPGNSSTDRVAFRLRIVGGACRGSTGSTLVAQLSKLLPYTEPAFTHHTDKGVRKASAKLLKV